MASSTTARATPPGAGRAPSLVRRVANLRVVVALPSVLSSVHRSGPAVARLDAGPYPLAYVRRPETVKALLDGRIPGVAERGRFFEDVARVIGTSSLVTCEGEQHRRLRRLLSRAFRPEQVADYAETMLAAASQLVGGFEDGATVVLGETMGRLTLEIAARALLGLERPEQLDDLFTVLRTGTRIFYRLLLPRRVSDALWRSRHSPANRRLAAAQARVDRFVDGLLAERRTPGGSAAGPQAAARAGRPANLLDVLLAEQEDGGLTDAEVRDQVVTFLFAGHETTAQALTWTFVLLDRHGEVRARLEEELDERLGGRLPAASDLGALRYTRAVVRESLRLFPPAWFLSREAAEATVIDGCPVPAGTLLLASPLALHRDGAEFAEPLRFAPERWMAPEDEGEAPAAYLPFGHGRRNCIGSSFALSELVLVLATIAAAWRLRLVAPDEVREHPTVTLRPSGPVPVVLERRARRAEPPAGS